MPAALLDTNAISDLMRDHPKVMARMGRQAAEKEVLIRRIRLAA
jgi:hypothetical protein